LILIALIVKEITINRLVTSNYSIVNFENHLLKIKLNIEEHEIYVLNNLIIIVNGLINELGKKITNYLLY